MKNHKGEIATLLTLGLVLIGGLITLGLSILSNNQKITTNSRAAETCADSSVPNPDKACCFCQNGSVKVYASSTARCNAQMSTPCTSAAYGNAYGATSWGYCNNNGSSYQGSCTGGSEGGEEGGEEEGTETEECPKPKFTCAEKGYGTSDEIFSSDADNVYYEGKNCNGDKIGNLNAFIKKCNSLVSGDCSEIECSLLLGAANPNVDFGNKSVFVKSGEDKYYKQGCIQTVDLDIACMPEAEDSCDAVNCKDLYGGQYPNINFGTKKVYTSSANPDVYFNLGCKDEIDPEEVCSVPQTPPLGGNYVTDISVKANGITYYNCGAPFTITQLGELEAFAQTCFNRFPGITPYVVQTRKGVYCCKNR